MHQYIAFLHERIAELTEIVESTAKDAARYQWATAPNTGFSTGVWQWLEGDNGRWLDKETADQLIDQAIAAPRGKPLFKDMIDQHDGLAEELAAVDAMIGVASTAEIHAMLDRIDAEVHSTLVRIDADLNEDAARRGAELRAYAVNLARNLEAVQPHARATPADIGTLSRAVLHMDDLLVQAYKPSEKT